MSAQATMWGPTEHVPGEGLDDDPTPRGVVRPVFGESMALYVHLFGPPKGHATLLLAPHGKARRVTADNPFRVLGVGSGYGCWESEFALWWVNVLGLPREWLHITGVEINPAREEHGRKWCDEWVTADWFDALRDHHELPTWDLIVGNPPFSELLDEAEDTERADPDPDELFGSPNWPLGMPGWLLEHAPAVLLLHTQQAFLRSAYGRACWRRHPPAASWLVPGGVKFRGPGVGADSRCYQVTLWLRGHSGPCSVHLLDDLTAKERAWSVIPGSESPDAARALGLPMVGDP